MKKKGISIAIMMGLLLLGACRETPQTTVIPTGTPTTGPVEEINPTVTTKPSAAPTLEPTVPPEATKKPELSVTVMPTPEATIVPEPSVTPVPTAEPTAVPKVEPTKAPEPTEEPEPSATPVPTPEASVTPEPTETPLPDLDRFIGHGWQSMTDITEQYSIVFPECFDETASVRSEEELLLTYSSKEQEEVVFTVRYVPGKLLTEVLEQSMEEWTVSDQQEKQFSYYTERDIMKYQGIVLELEFDKKLLGSVSEEETMTGIMQIEFGYPVENSAEYETDAYRYFIEPVQ